MTFFPRSRQHGAALFIFLAAIGLAALLFVGYQIRNTGRLEISDEAAETLSESKDALIGYTVSPTGAGQRPGDMLRPDTASETTADYDGTTDGCLDVTKASGLPHATTGANMRCLGRLPWKDLKLSNQGLVENDPTGVMPWYAVSANLVDPTCLDILNSDTITLPTPTVTANSYATTCHSTAILPHPWLTVRDASGNVISNRVAAVLIIPGAPVGGQSRPTAPLAGASAYLDSVTVGGTTYSNADMDNDFITAPPSDTFNDTVLFITIDELMAAVEKRAATEAGNALKTFYSTCGFYPKPVNFTSSSCYTGTCTSDTALTQGRFPYSPKPTGATSYPDWSGLPAWFQENRWDSVLFYAVSDGFKSGGNGSTQLTVDGSANSRALFYSPASYTVVDPNFITNFKSAPSTDISRVTSPNPTTLGKYLLSAENSNGDTTFLFNNAQEKGYRRDSGDTSAYTPSSPNPTCGCPAGQILSWTVGGSTCSATSNAGFDGNTATLASSAPGTTGSASIICNIALWQVSASPAPTCTGSAPTWPFDYSDSGPTGWPGVPTLDSGTVAVGGSGNPSSTTSGDDKISISGNLTSWIELKGGNDQLLVTGNLTGGGTFGSGNDTAKIGGDMTGYLDMGQGNDYLDIGDDATGWIDAKEGNDNIVIGGNMVSGTSLGSGDDNLHIKGSVLGSIDSGEGNDQIRIEGNAVATIELDSGDDYLLIFGNALYISGDAGNDVVLIGGNAQSWIDLGEGEDYLEILGNSAGLDAGNDSDIIKINGSLSNSVNLGAGNDILVLGGTFTWISGGTGSDKVYLGAYTTANCAALLGSKVGSDVEHVKVSNGVCRGSDFTVP